MKIRLVAFATAAEMLGSRRMVVEQPAGASVGDLLDSLTEATPGFEALRSRLAVAVNGRLAVAADTLTEDAEVALLPPVSGGRPPERPHLTDRPIDTSAVLEKVADPSCGALLLFLGCVRSDPDAPGVTHLTYDAYEPMAAAALAKICHEIGAPDCGVRIAIVHRLGDVPLGEASVAIATAAAHRGAAYDANRQALERLKREVPIWKREHFADGSAAWREEETLAPGI